MKKFVLGLVELSYEVRSLKLANLPVSDQVQRAFSQARAEELIDDWIEPLARIVVVQRDDKSLWVVGGQHTKYAAERLGYDKFDCIVILGVNSPKKEALLVTACNNVVKPVRKRDHFMELLGHGDEEALRVKSIARSAHFMVSNNPGSWDTIADGMALLNAVRKHSAKSLGVALGFIWDTWFGQKGASEVTVILGCIYFIEEIGVDSDLTAISNKLKLIPLVDIKSEAKVVGAGRENQGRGRAFANVLKSLVLE